MKYLKIKLLFFFSFLSLFSFGDSSYWLCHVFDLSLSDSTKFYYRPSYKTFSKDDAFNSVYRYVPIVIQLPYQDLLIATNAISLVNLLNNNTLSIQSSSNNALKKIKPSTSKITNSYTNDLKETYYITNILSSSNRPLFIKNAYSSFKKISNISNKILFTENSILHIVRDFDTDQVYAMVDYDIFCHSVVSFFKDNNINFIRENIEYLLPFLISNFNNISNSLDRVLTNSDYGISLLHNIDSYVSGFPLSLDDIKTNTSYLKLKSYASGTLSDFSFGNPDSYAEGPLYILYQLTRQERGEPENLVVTQREAYNYLGLDKEYGSWPRPNDYQRINQVLATQVAAKTASQEKKYQDLYSISDDDGYVIDPETGEKVSLQDAFKNWNNQKSQGAIANYQYNNPAATNGLLGAIKKSLTEESDWRILDKGFKEKVENFTQEIQDDGIKINQGGNPLRVSIAQDVPIYIDISSEQFKGITFSTDTKAPLEQFRDSFNSFFQLWSVYSGVTDKFSRSWLDLINENNSNYYDFVRDKMYVTFSNDLASIVRNTSRTNDFYNSLSNQLEKIISSHTVDVAATSPFEVYANKYVSTLKQEIPDAFLLSDQDYQPFYGSTNFEQAIILMLHDQHVLAQNNLKANMMSADYIRGIYHSLYTGSNIAQRVDYITNQVFSANSLSTDPDHDYSSAYASQADELKTHLDDIVTSIAEFKSQTLEKLTPIANQIFADYILPSKLKVLEIRGNKFEVDLIKYRSIFDLMHYASSVAWLIIGLLMLPRVIYMLLVFSLKILGKFYNIMNSR